MDRYKKVIVEPAPAHAGEVTITPFEESNTSYSYGSNIKNPGEIYTNRPFSLELKNKPSGQELELTYFVNNREVCKGLPNGKCMASIQKAGKIKLKICNESLRHCDTLWVNVKFNNDQAEVTDKNPDNDLGDIDNNDEIWNDDVVVTKSQPVKPVEPESITKEFTSNGKAGYRSSDRCDDNKKVVTTPCTLKLTPKKDFELKYVKVLSSKSARVDVTLSSNGGDKTEFLKNRQILAGQPSELNFQSLDYVFRKGVTYTITVAPVPGNSFELEDFSACNTADGGNNEVTISQAGGQVFFEVTYKY